jgi:hypothetical protein
MQMERLHLGEPTDIIRHLDQTASEPMTIEMAEMKIKAAQQAADSYKRSKLVMLQGGLSAGEAVLAGLTNSGVDLDLGSTPAAARDVELDDNFDPKPVGPERADQATIQARIGELLTKETA